MRRHAAVLAPCLALASPSPALNTTATWQTNVPAPTQITVDWSDVVHWDVGTVEGALTGSPRSVLLLLAPVAAAALRLRSGSTRTAR
jgi:hypothetical protein